MYQAEQSDAGSRRCAGGPEPQRAPHAGCSRAPPFVLVAAALVSVVAVQVEKSEQSEREHHTEQNEGGQQYGGQGGTERMAMMSGWHDAPSSLALRSAGRANVTRHTPTAVSGENA